jgi:c-di-AMP phosphodiesterase-like protein
MWLLSLLPDSLMFFIVIAISLVGLTGYLLGSFGGVIPTLKPHANTIKLVSVVVMLVGVYLYGGYSTEMSWRNKVKEVKQKVVVAEEKSKTANVEVVIKYKDRIKVIHDTKVVTKEVLKEKIVAVDNCSVPDIVTVLNKAATKPEETTK